METYDDDDILSETVTALGNVVIHDRSGNHRTAIMEEPRILFL